MATLQSQLQPINITVGVQPPTDRTRLNTPHYTNADKIRFWRGSPQKIGGFNSVTFEYDEAIEGVARTLYSGVIGGLLSTVIGTNTDLYSLYGQSLTNISPLESTTHAVPDSLSTDYATLGSNPVGTFINSNVLTITDSNAASYQVGDTYTLSGATTTNGVPNTEINTDHLVRALTASTVTISVSTSATSTGNGGGASVVRKTGLITVAATAHGQSNGDRTKLDGATTTGGVTDTEINEEFIVRNASTNAFGVMTAGTATSHVTGGGGSGTTYQKQIAAGNQNESVGIGYGGGLYGMGLYGVAKTFNSVSLPRIWYLDRFGDNFIGTPGNQSGVYTWDGDPTVAPVLVNNAPTDVNYAFVSDNILVTFGHGNTPNQIFASDQGDPTNWTASSTNQVYQDIIEGAGQLLTHVPCLGVNLIFTPNQTYRFSYIGLPDVWQISLLDNSIGIIAPMARCSVNNVAYWMSQNNFYKWAGGNVEVIPSNTQDECTALEYVFGNINTAQLAKCFAWFNPLFNEVWFHYPSASSNECDRYITVSILDNVWSIGTFDRSCAEYPALLFNYPRMISPEGIFYNHEQGVDADGSAMPWVLTSNLRSTSKYASVLPGLIPDSTQTGNITVNFKGYMFPQSINTLNDNSYIVSPTTEKIETTQSGRFWAYEWSGNEVGNNWNMGVWLEYIQSGAAN